MSRIESIALHAFRNSSSLHRRMEKLFLNPIALAAEELAICFQTNHKVILFGNGGSAGDAQHLAAEFVGSFQKDRRPLPAIALSSNTSIVTSIANDFGFEHVFSRQLQALGCEGDLAIAISTSGNSPNVLEGINAAKRIGIRTIGLTGRTGGRLVELVDILFVVPDDNTARIQECHITIGHVLCEIVESIMFSEKNVFEKNVFEETNHLNCTSKKIVDINKLTSLREEWRQRRMRVVWTNGCFDLLHVGHIRSLEVARSLGDVLIVGLNDDDSVRQLKGEGHPVQIDMERAEMIAALEFVDYVTIFNGLTPIGPISQIKPDIHCKGEDFAPPYGKPIPEADIVKAYGGRVVYLPLVAGKSTSSLLKKIKSS